MPLPHTRHQAILDLLESGAAVEARALARRLGVTPMTIWRDLETLGAKGLLRRVRGGAVRGDRKPEAPFATKEGRRQAAKRRIAAGAAPWIEAGGTYAIEGGTTVAELVPALLTARATLLTNSLPILGRIHASRRPHACIASGGLLSPVSGNFCGAEAVRFFRRRRVDVFFMGGTGLSAEQGITDPNPQEIEVKQAMAAAATRIVALIDAAKLGRDSLHRVLPLDRLHALITDAPEDHPVLRAVRAQGVRVVAVR